MDTLSWARDYDVDVVGLDFSPVAIEQARALADDVVLTDRAEFVEFDVYDLPAGLDREFDVVVSGCNCGPNVGTSRVSSAVASSA